MQTGKCPPNNFKFKELTMQPHSLQWSSPVDDLICSVAFLRCGLQNDWHLQILVNRNRIQALPQQNFFVRRWFHIPMDRHNRFLMAQEMRLIEIFTPLTRWRQGRMGCSGTSGSWSGIWFQKWRIPKMVGSIRGKTQSKMDENRGYPHLRKPPHGIYSNILRVVHTYSNWRTM